MAYKSVYWQNSWSLADFIYTIDIDVDIFAVSLQFPLQLHLHLQFAFRTLRQLIAHT